MTTSGIGSSPLRMEGEVEHAEHAEQGATHPDDMEVTTADGTTVQSADPPVLDAGAYAELYNQLLCEFD